MAVLKQTSPTELPVAPSPCPAMTVPSASTRRAVSGVSVQGAGSGRIIGVLASQAIARAAARASPVGQSAYGWRRTLGEGADLVNSAALRLGSPRSALRRLPAATKEPRTRSMEAPDARTD